ncbi:MAG: hypothetical protein P1V35_05095 [Planctomycetota bacterium]|nr:hypothetical protein [Planctomycetota bacterium]
MDSLALLCTLHADGPATLRRLRKAGCQSLVDLDRVGADSVAELLAIPPAVARRLVREARILNERVGGDPLDAEEAPDGMAVAPLGNVQAPLTEGADLDSKDRDLIRQVLGDARPVGGLRSLNLQAEEEGSEEPMGGAFAGAEMPELDGAMEPTAPEPSAPAYPLMGRVDGLDERVAAMLHDADIQTLTALVEADASRLARSTGLSFGPLRRLQFLARKSLQVGGEISIPAPERPESSPVAHDPQETAAIDLQQDPEIAPASDGTISTFELPRPAQFSSLQDGDVEPPAEEALESVSPMAPTPEAEDPFAKETWPEAKAPTVNELEPEAAGPMADETPKAEAPQPLGRWMPREMREAQSHTEECAEPEPVLIPPPPPRRFWEPKRFWEARKNRRQAAAASEQKQETENTQGGNLPPAPAPEPKVEPESDSAPMEMPTGKDLGDLRWDFREPRFKAESSGKGGFQFEAPERQAAQRDASGPFA